MKRHLLKHHQGQQSVSHDIDALMMTIDNKAQITMERMEAKADELTTDVQLKVDINSNTILDENNTNINKDDLVMSPLSQSEGPADVGDGTPRGHKFNHCPYCSFTCEAPSKLKCHLEIHENLKRYKCVYCGKRSNWIWDIRKHIRNDHPGYEMNVDELSEDEAKATLAEYLCKYKSPAKKGLQYQVKAHMFTHHPTAENLHSSLLISKQCDTPVNHRSYTSLDGTMDISPDCTPKKSPIQKNLTCGSKSAKQRLCFDKDGLSSDDKKQRCRPYKCSICGRRSNWKWDVRKHMGIAHPGEEGPIIIMDMKEAKETMEQLRKMKMVHKSLSPVKRLRVNFDRHGTMTKKVDSPTLNQYVDPFEEKKIPMLCLSLQIQLSK